ncbi:MAG: hypothetical protein ABIM74_03625 [candidate division WOR-3 bacterium]
MMSLYITTSLLFGQGLWAKAYTGNFLSPLSSWSIIQSNDGNYVLTGHVENVIAGDLDILVLKLAPDGSVIWDRVFDLDNYDQYAFSVFQSTVDNSYVISGYTGFGNGQSKALVLKLESDGSLAWARIFGDTLVNQVYSSTQATDGSYVFAGRMFTSPNTSDILVFKLNTDGSLVWARTFGIANRNDFAHTIIETRDDGYAIAGYTDDLLEDPLIIKIRADGSLEWARIFSMLLSNGAQSIAQASDNSYIVAGRAQSPYGNHFDDALVLKLFPDGNLMWASRIDNSDNSRNDARSLIQDRDGNFVIGGSGTISLIKLSSDGSLIWCSRPWVAVNSLLQNQSGQYVITQDFQVQIIPPDGNYPECTQFIPAIVESPSIDVYDPSIVTGIPNLPVVYPVLEVSSPSITPVDLCEPLKFEENEGIDQIKILCHPSPNGVLFISSLDTELKIYSVIGQAVYTGNLKKGENFVPLKKGVYVWMAGNSRGKVAIR